MQNFNANWQFKMEDEATWSPVSIPHDWLIADTKNLYKSGVGCYKKTFDPGIHDPEKRLFLRFDGIYMDSTLYVNGQKAGEWKHGYTTFTQEITQFVKPGENEVLITVNHQAPNSRWYSGAGIYRDCWLIKKNAAHFAIDGIYVTPRKCDGDLWHVEINAEVESAGVSYEVQHRILCASNNTQVASGTHSISIQSPKIWDILHPNCYILESELVVNGAVTDIVRTRFGFREIAFTTHDGFFLNGRRVPLNGVCQHHDLGALGAAFNRDALRRQMLILKDMGVNAIRTAHNPPAPAFMEFADEMGFLVVTEFTDIWRHSKTEYDYARFFDEWVDRDVASWVRRDRNSPSIIMWSVGNEVSDTQHDDGLATMTLLMELVKTHDPKNHAPATLASNHMSGEKTQKCADVIKLIGYNYSEYLYHDHHEKNPSWIIFGGETASTVQSRGIYHFPLKKAILRDDDLQCSSLGNSTVNWGGKSSEFCITAHRDAPFNPGQFLWTGTDYIGEPTPYTTKNSYFGQVDTAGFPKDSFYIYKSAWTDVKETPVLHLFPYWDWSPGQPVDVRIATNAPRVELFLNGKSLGTTDINHAKDLKLVANYIVPYEPGVIKAVAYDENGKIIAETERHSFGDAVELKLVSNSIGELTFTEIYAVDANGNTVENATNRVKVTVKNGTLLGLDNGDSTDYDQYQGTDNRRLFSGKLLAISKGENGQPPQVSAEFDMSDIPIRKIELSVTGSSPYIITAKTYPPSATHSGLEWRLTNDAGVDSPLGQLEACGNTATLTSKSDGEVFVRCATRNGQAHQALISLQQINITGYGTPFVDPYAFVLGALHSHSNVPLGNGLERGVLTARVGETHIGYANLDFGSFGSDEMTIDLQQGSSAPLPIDIWLGMPGDANARKVSTVTYEKQSIQNTYQSQTFTLPERITGVQTLCLVIARQVNVRGFRFKPKAFDKVPFAANDSIYGDNFAINGHCVEGIGNNVSINFEGMNFDIPAAGVEISWRSKQGKNSVRMVFTDTEGKETINTLNFHAGENNGTGYGSCKFKLEVPFKGAGSISYIFLPGSDIDLEWFRFTV